MSVLNMELLYKFLTAANVETDWRYRSLALICNVGFVSVADLSFGMFAELGLVLLSELWSGSVCSTKMFVDHLGSRAEAMTITCPGTSRCLPSQAREFRRKGADLLKKWRSTPRHKRASCERLQAKRGRSSEPTFVPREPNTP